MKVKHWGELPISELPISGLTFTDALDHSELVRGVASTLISPMQVQRGTE